MREKAEISTAVICKTSLVTVLTNMVHSLDNVHLWGLTGLWDSPVHAAVCPSQIAIPVMSVTHVKKTKTAILLPNALVIATANDRVRRKEVLSHTLIIPLKVFSSTEQHNKQSLQYFLFLSKPTWRLLVAFSHPSDTWSYSSLHKMTKICQSYRQHEGLLTVLQSAETHTQGPEHPSSRRTHRWEDTQRGSPRSPSVRAAGQKN